MVFITLISLHIIPQLSQIPTAQLLETWWLPFFSHLIFMQDYIGREPIIDGLFWSIPIEIKFYMLLPIFIYLLNKVKNNTYQIYSIIGVFCIYIMLKSFYFYTKYGFNNIDYSEYIFNIRTPFHMALDGLTIGVLCAFIINNEKVKQIKPNGIITNIILFIGLFIFYLASSSTHFNGEVATFFEANIVITLLTISFGFILLALVSKCIATNFFSNAILGFIAKISYSMYLTHMFSLYFQASMINLINTFIQSTTLCWLISLPLFFGFAVTISYLLYSFVEKPIIKWSKRKWS